MKGVYREMVYDETLNKLPTGEWLKEGSSKVVAGVKRSLSIEREYQVTKKGSSKTTTTTMWVAPRDDPTSDGFSNSDDPRWGMKETN